MVKADCRQDFPLLLQKDEEGRMLAYLDNAAATLKPKQVINAVSTYYEAFNANPHRGAYSISVRAAETFGEVRGKAARFIGANDQEEAIFTSGATDAINLVAMSYGEQAVGQGDEILISALEHHGQLMGMVEKELARAGEAVCGRVLRGPCGAFHIS